MTDPDSSLGDEIPVPDPDEPVIDAEFREAEPERKSRSGPGWGASLILAVLAAMAGGALGYAGAERLPGLLGGPAEVSLPDLPEEIAARSDLTRETEARLELQSRLTREVTRLEERLGRAEDRLSAPPIRIEDGPGEDMQEELAALEARLAAIEAIEPGDAGGVTDADLARTLASASSRIDTLDARLETELNRTESAQLDLETEIRELRDELAELRDDMAETRTETETRVSAAAEAALALSTIDAAARRGQPFQPALEALRRVKPGLNGLDALAPIAATGAPTVEDLVRQFPAVADAARAALQPEADQSGAMGIAGRLFGDAVQVRREGDAPVYEALQAAQEDLAEGDLGGAIARLEQIEGPAGEALSDWLVKARARRTLERTLDVLRLDLMAEDR